MKFYGFHGKRSKVRNKSLRISMVEVQDGIPTLNSNVRYPAYSHFLAEKQQKYRSNAPTTVKN